MKSIPHVSGRWPVRMLLAGLVIGLAHPLASAGEESATTDKPTTAEKEADKKEKKPDFPPFDEVSEGHEKIPGFFDLYYDKKKDHLLAVIPKSMLGKDFLMATSISGGPAFTGFMWGGYVGQWHEMGKKLVLIQPDLRHARAENSTVEDVVARTYTDRIVLSTKIVSKRDGDPVIDFDDVLKKDRVGLSRVYNAKMDSELSR